MKTPHKFFLELKKLNLLFMLSNIEKCKYDIEMFKSFFNRVDVVKNAKKAHDYLSQNNYDVLLIKCDFEDLNYLNFIAEVKTKYPHLYIAIISENLEKDNLLDWINAGVDGFLKESFDLDIFLGELYKILYQKLKIADELNILQQYKDIVDENLIVSKTDIRGYIIYANKAFEEISGFSKEELIGKPHNIVRHPDMKSEVFKKLWNTILSKRAWRGLIKNRKKNGDSYYVDTVIKPLFDIDGNIKEFIALRKDVTNFISAEELINDKLKVIKNALLILVSIDNYEDLKILYTNEVLNKFKRRLLRRIKNLLKEKMKLKNNSIEDYLVKDDVLGFLIETYDEKELRSVLSKIINDVINWPIVVEGLELLPLIRVSYAYGKEHLYENAIIGIETIKEGEEKLIFANRLCVKKKVEVMKNMEILKTIEYALSNNKVISLFQPIVDNKTKKIIKYESLVRIIDKNSKVISPLLFLDIAKKSGLYTNITLQVIENSFKAIKEKKIAVSINISPSDILRESIKNKIYKLLKELNPPKGMVTFELLEDEIIKYPKVLQEFIDKAIELNANIAIDDFGEGYSNFSRIVEFKADIIKIDGSLIKNIETDSTRQSIVKAIVSFAKKENKKTVAEFVESEEIYNKLVEIGVDYSQGYYFSKPLLLEEI